MARQEVLVGLDIGTTKVCTVIGWMDMQNRLQVSGYGVAPSRGLKKGVVVDVAETVAAVRESVERAERMADERVRAACVGITGDHVACLNRRSVVTVPGGYITAKDVDRVLEEARSMILSEGREIIHSVERGFAIDGTSGVKRPIGMAGTRLEVETHIVTGSVSFIRNVAQCVEQAGVRVEHLVLEPIATGEAVATQAEKDLGVALIDIGGGTSDIAVFVDGSVAYSAAVPVAGNHVTRDIAIGLRTPVEEAEQIKRGKGAAMARMMSDTETIEVVTAGTGERLQLPRTILGEIIEARMRELFALTNAEIEKSGLQNRLASGIILTGGGSLLPGALELAQECFEFPVRLGRPLSVVGMDEISHAQKFNIYATGVGLLRYAFLQPRGDHAAFSPRNLWDVVVSFFRRLPFFREDDYP